MTREEAIKNAIVIVRSVLKAAHKVNCRSGWTEKAVQATDEERLRLTETFYEEVARELVSATTDDELEGMEE